LGIGGQHATSAPPKPLDIEVSGTYGLALGYKRRAVLYTEDFVLKKFNLKTHSEAQNYPVK
jgi:hypothetical protein